MKSDQTKYLIRFLSFLLLAGCADLSEIESHSFFEKTRSDNLWSAVTGFPDKQDLAILLPRLHENAITIDIPTHAGDALMPGRWLKSVDEAYWDTEVGTAFGDENLDRDWQVVSLRIAPCSPLGKRPGPEASRLCWPEVRLVWQPVLMDYFIGWTTVEAFSDDRAMHALYHVHASQDPARSKSILTDLKSRLKASNEPVVWSEDQWNRFYDARQAAMDELLNAVLGLRSGERQAQEYGTLDYRVEAFGSDAERNGFYTRLSDFLARFGQARSLHTLTSFSLPEGQNPSGSDTWVFIAFEADEGHLSQLDLNVADPVTGETLVEIGQSETVRALQGDEVLVDATGDWSVNAEKLKQQVVLNREDQGRLRERINDPNQTLVPNTSCASCHSFNDLSFDFHNLSYLQEMEITIAPRVRKDVTADINWLRRHP